MKKYLLVVACAFVAALMVVVIWFQEYLPFKAQVFIASYIIVPAHLQSLPADRKITVQNWQSFEQWTEASALCHKTFWFESVQTPHFLRKIKSLGVNVDTHPQELPDAKWEIKHHVGVLGMSVSQIQYWGDSGSEFFVRVNSPPDVVIKSLGAGALPKYFPELNYLAVVLTEKPTLNNPFPNLIFVRGAQDNQHSYIGCREFDY
ncbi:hypothetical protein SFSGTM_23400 [Sulfuriferula nivalis]|uniref:Uncharacterized protein n=2 Tax=Sulfuriferula nivalis TaxID=2675298 RepID=A0A809SAI2_9PROT|nr:hypothetical protein SFSGTM_23400 [Sulfuriferula nivalis]